MPIPFDQLPIGEGLDPTGNPGASFFIDRAKVELIEREGPEWEFDDARFIPEAIRNPDAIFEGLKRPNHLKSLCYSVRVTFDPDDEKNQSPPRYGYVFVAFVRPGVGGYVVFDWEWREEDPDNPGHPSGWVNDFARRTWHKT